MWDGQRWRDRMTEQELIKKIRSSAEEIEIPETLSPGQMRRKLEEENSPQSAGAFKDRKTGWYTGRRTIAAAVVLFVCGMGVFATYRENLMDGVQMDMTAEGTQQIPEGAAGDAASVEEAVGTDVGEALIPPKSDAGQLYVVAKDYGEIYDRLKEEDVRRGGANYEMEIVEDVAEGAASDTMGSSGNSSLNARPYESAESQGIKESLEQSTDLEGADHYSKTNLQTEGVDESDIVKTDGSYLYIVSNHFVRIVDVRGEKMRDTGRIPVTLSSAADRVVEMYAEGDTLSLIVEREETQLTQKDSRTNAMEDVYYIGANRRTELQTYDIADRENPVLRGSITQDGSYKTSRKIGGIRDLFTEKNVEQPHLARTAAALEENAGGWIPLVDGRPIAADCIYLPEWGTNGLVASSVDVDDPTHVVDNTLILNNYVNIYVSAGALYLYGQDFSAGSMVTQIAKFALKDGVIDAVGATAAAGEVYDTFAINEYKGKLRILTTDWSRGENENLLYLFDENLKLTGSLEGIARGEQIYAARYLGDIVYFVTYRNTDPLFAVDLSDATKPQILSELKITGFSEYLHFWGEDHLVGIGYETDSKDGSIKGVKLAMFDISDPAELKVTDTCVLADADYTPALYDYKCVLADAGENLIGFAVESYERGEKSGAYLLFSWEDGKFENQLTERLRGYGDVEDDLYAGEIEQYRGLYIGARFYLVSQNGVTSYDRENEYKMIERFEL